ncbi:MAG: VWA domain-containing protein [Microbacteriaceae bacterium]
MTLLNWWMLPAWALLVAGAAAILLWRRRRRRADDGIRIAHAERLTALPGYRRAFARYRLLVLALAALTVLGAGAGAVLTARAATERVEHSDLASRDIVLCLDVSGSMVDYDSEVVEVFQTLAKKFEGERLSLVLFNASAVTYFPLTSDLDYIEQQLGEVQAAFADPDESYFEGTLVGDGSSLVGDGLASCVTRFPDAESTGTESTDAERSRSVILVTDNQVAGDEVFTLPEAGELAQSRSVRVYGINPGDTAGADYLSDLADEFRSTVVATGGAYYALEDTAAVPGIVERITAEQATVTAGPARVVVVDRTTVASWIVLLVLAGMSVIGWAVRR